MSLIKSLHKETIQTIAPSALPTVKKLDEVKNLSEMITAETEIAGVKELAFMMKSLELKEICDNYLGVEYKEGANRNNKMMLTKRFMESFEGVTINKWFQECDDRETLVSICKVMGFKVTSKTPIAELQKAAAEETRLYGEQVVLNRLSVSALQQIADDMGLDGQDNTSSKKILIESIVTKTDIPERERKPKQVIRKKAIAKATLRGELEKYYSAAQLNEWCETNGLKTSGTKKALIARILAYNNGDKENTTATNTSRRVGRKSKESSAPTKKGSKKAQKIVEEEEASDEEVEEDEASDEVMEEVEEEAAPAPTKKSSRKIKKVVEEETSDEEMEEEKEASAEEASAEEASAEEKEASVEEKEASAEEAEPSFDEEAEKKAIAAERQLREDPVEAEAEAEDEDEDEDEISISDSSSQFPKDIKGVIFAVSGKFKTKSKKDLVTIIENNGGIISASLTKKVQVFLCTKESSVAKATKSGIQCFGEEYLSNFF